LFWRAQDETDANWVLRMRLMAEDASVVGEYWGPVANETHATSDFARNEVVLGQYNLPVDREAKTGSASILLNLMDADTGQPALPEDVVLSRLDIVGHRRQFSVPQDLPIEVGQNLGNRLVLLGAEIAPMSVGSDSNLSFRLYWQALTDMDKSYTVFTHLLGSDEQLWGQHDGVPEGGDYPTDRWAAGEVVVDEHMIQMHPAAPPGDYVIAVGMYDAETGERLKLCAPSQECEGDRILLPPLSIE
jgi:hypothetical protein